MINFEQINHFSRGYDILNRYLRFTHNHFYYKKFHIYGKENIPKKGVPTFIISNHQNGLMDALAILYLFSDRRQPVYIARGDIFKNQMVAKILRFLKIMPTFRSRDGNRKDIEQNNTSFGIAAQVLKDGGTLAIFPEAGHQAGHFLSSFKKGFPRIAFKAEEFADFNLNLQIVPLNIHYSDYFNFRSELLVTVGKPFSFEEFFDLYKTEPNQAYLALNEKSKREIKSLAIDIEDKEHYADYETLRTIFHTPLKELKKRDKQYLHTQLNEDITIVSNIDYLKERDPSTFEVLMQTASDYRNELKKTNLRDWLIHNKKITVCHLIFQSLILLLLFPVFLFGFIHNIIPFSLPNILKRKIKDPMLHSSLHYALSVVISFPIIYIILFFIILSISKCVGISLLYIGAVFVTLFIFYGYKRAFIKWKAAWRYYLLNKKNDPQIILLKKLKEELFSIKKRAQI